MRLVIVESPGKIKKIEAILGAGYRVAASVGHVRDLAPTERGGKDDLVAGVGADFRPQYVTTERGKEVVSKLLKLAKDADDVVLATDPDREGEAIAWHLQSVLKLKNPKRVTFNEITPSAVKAAIAQPRSIDAALVEAQEARRVLDRMVGFVVSPTLSNMIGQPLSAGRVQSPAVRLVVERERAIRAFVPTRHYSAELYFAEGWKAVLQVKPLLAGSGEHWTDLEMADAVAAVRAVSVTSFADSESRRSPPAPFTTSTLQQFASTQLKLNPKACMEAAQKLYEQGAISYHRTDNPNLSAEAQAEIRSYAKANGLPAFDGERKWKAKDGAQEAHEAIRPAHIEVEEAGTTDQERALYKLIRDRALACQLAESVYATRVAVLEAIEPGSGRTVTFEARGRTLTFVGWEVLKGKSAKDDGEDDDIGNPVPALAVGQGITAVNGKRLDKMTKAPARFTEASLVEELEARGVGRPSTYAAILENVVSREYIAVSKERQLSPTPTGEALVDALVGKCRFVDLDFTAAMEGDLDLVAAGRRQYASVVGSAWRQLGSEIEGLRAAAPPPKHPCPACGAALHRRKGAHGFFWGCSAYPQCNTTLPDADGAPGERPPPPPDSGHRCDDCQSPLIRRTKPGKGGFDFWGCTGYPTCKKTYKPSTSGEPIRT